MNKKNLKNQSSGITRSFVNVIIMLFICIAGFSQNVGISPSGAIPPNASAGLDVNFADKGLLMPRVALQSTTSFAPLSAHVTGMIVYNTAKVGDVSPGYYYDDGTKWIPFFTRAINAGDMQYWNGTKWVNIPIGLVGQTLTINSSGVPTWIQGPLPSLATVQLTSITSTSATSGGVILNDGGNAVTAYGVCWAMTSAPTKANSFTTNGSGIGSFTSNLTGLTTGTIYYVRAYATTIYGTAYGNELSFTTP
jgi:hypothetical protein